MQAFFTNKEELNIFLTNSSDMEIYNFLKKLQKESDPQNINIDEQKLKEQNEYQFWQILFQKEYKILSKIMRDEKLFLLMLRRINLAKVFLKYLEENCEILKLNPEKLVEFLIKTNKDIVMYLFFVAKNIFDYSKIKYAKFLEIITKILDLNQNFPEVFNDTMNVLLMYDRSRFKSLISIYVMDGTLDMIYKMIEKINHYKIVQKTLMLYKDRRQQYNFGILFIKNLTKGDGNE